MKTTYLMKVLITLVLPIVPLQQRLCGVVAQWVELECFNSPCRNNLRMLLKLHW